MSLPCPLQYLDYAQQQPNNQNIIYNPNGGIPQLNQIMQPVNIILPQAKAPKQEFSPYKKDPYPPLYPPLILNPAESRKQSKLIDEA